MPSKSVPVNGDESGFGSDVDGNCGRNRVRCPEIIEVELSDSDTSTEFAFSQPERNNDGAPRWPYTLNDYSANVTLQANMETRSKHNQVLSFFTIVFILDTRCFFLFLSFTFFMGAILVV